MSGHDILKELRKEDGREQIELFTSVSHLIGRKSFNNNIRSLLKSKDIMKIERTKYDKGVRKNIIKFYLCD